jgi:hypothetical protein
VFLTGGFYTVRLSSAVNLADGRTYLQCKVLYDRLSSMTMSTLKQPSALIPIAMSMAALVTVLVHVALYGTAREADEGTAAHVWQLLMAGQMPVVGFYALKWLPRAPATALRVLALQAGAALAALAPVYWLGF